MAKLAKITELSEVLASRGELPALRFAAKLTCLGDRRDTIQTAWSAHQNPAFYSDLGKNPEDLLQAGFSALRELIAANG
jgi:hypothetical protein